MMHPVLYRAFEETASHLAGRPVELRLEQPYNVRARGACFVDKSTGKAVIQVRPSLWVDDREAFWHVYLHEVEHARKHALNLAPSDGRALKVKRGDDFKGLLLGVKDMIEELQADTWALRWKVYAGCGPILVRLLRLQMCKEN